MKDIMNFAETWKDIDDKDIEKMKLHISKLRERSTNELLERNLSK